MNFHFDESGDFKRDYTRVQPVGIVAGITIPEGSQRCAGVERSFRSCALLDPRGTSVLRKAVSPPNCGRVPRPSLGFRDVPPILWRKIPVHACDSAAGRE
jgi:hypothetical protein